MRLGIQFGFNTPPVFATPITIDRAPLEGGTLDLPDVVYKYIDPTVTARLPIHPSSAVTVSGRFLAMRDTGPSSPSNGSTRHD